MGLQDGLEWEGGVDDGDVEEEEGEESNLEVHQHYLPCSLK